MTRGLLALLACLIAGPGTAQGYKAPRTPLGQPDLQGVWTTHFILPLEARDDTPALVVSEAESKVLARRIAEEQARYGVNYHDPEIPALNFAMAEHGMAIVRGERRTRQIVQPADGRVPWTPAALREVRRIESMLRDEVDPPIAADHPEQRPAAERCLSLGAPPTGALNELSPRLVVQTRDHVVIQTEYGADVRIIPFAREHRPAPMRDPLGDSIARWKGETLVIETIRLPANSRIRIFPFLLVPSNATVIEKYTRIAEDELLYQYTVIHPGMYSGPWLAEYSLYPQKQPMYEFACHEGNYSLPNIMAGQRELEKRARAAGGGPGRE